MILILVTKSGELEISAEYRRLDSRISQMSKHNIVLCDPYSYGGSEYIALDAIGDSYISKKRK